MDEDELLLWAIVILLGPGILVFFFSKATKILLIMLGAALLLLLPVLFEVYSGMQSFYKANASWPTVIFAFGLGFGLLGGLLILASMGVVVFFSWLRSKINKPSDS